MVTEYRLPVRQSRRMLKKTTADTDIASGQNTTTHILKKQLLVLEYYYYYSVMCKTTTVASIYFKVNTCYTVSHVNTESKIAVKLYPNADFVFNEYSS
jgi:hypothetical protein